MAQQLIIAGSGFAGVWAALAAARARSLAGDAAALEISVVSPSPQLLIRPRLYETAFDDMTPPLGELFEAVGVRHIAGSIESIDTEGRRVVMRDDKGDSRALGFDRFVLATGSTLARPDVPGLDEYAFHVDDLDGARALDRHLRGLAQRSASPARDTVVVVGGGFTGIETASELPARMRDALGAEASVRVVIVEQAGAIGPDLGPGPRPVIEQALAANGVELRTGAGVAAIDADGVTTAAGERIAAATVVWTGGARAHSLAAQIPGEHDRFGRVVADRELRAAAAPGVFVTGDVAAAATDDAGNTSLMSCQHALILGRVAGHNAAAELLGLPTAAYSQPKYVTCLDLGPWGAVYTEGWEREVKMQGEEAKALKRSINTEWIYPPPPDREAALELADPAFVIVA
ncbi:MAG: NAD(P)/FAD-dependent oxidoreductase [Gammaproteobacteria bacterium]